MTKPAGTRSGAAHGAGLFALIWSSFYLLPLLLLLLHQHVADIQAIRTGYRLPQSMGRSAGGDDNLGSGRDLFKKFMLWRGLFPQEPPRDNIIVVPQPSPTVSTYTTPTTTTTTTTTTTSNNNNNSTRRWRNLEDLPANRRPAPRRPQRLANAKTRNNAQLRQKKKKRRHRHINKRRRQRRHR